MTASGQLNVHSELCNVQTADFCLQLYLLEFTIQNENFCNQNEILCNQSEILCNQSEIPCNQNEIFCNQNEILCNQSEDFCNPLTFGRKPLHFMFGKNNIKKSSRNFC